MKTHALLTALIEEALRLQAKVEETEELVAKASKAIEELGRVIYEMEKKQ